MVCQGCPGLGFRGQWYIQDDVLDLGEEEVGGSDEGRFHLWPKAPDLPLDFT